MNDSTIKTIFIGGPLHGQWLIIDSHQTRYCVYELGEGAHISDFLKLLLYKKVVRSWRERLFSLNPLEKFKYLLDIDKRMVSVKTKFYNRYQYSVNKPICVMVYEDYKLSVEVISAEVEMFVKLERKKFIEYNKNVEDLKNEWEKRYVGTKCQG